MLDMSKCKGSATVLMLFYAVLMLFYAVLMLFSLFNLELLVVFSLFPVLLLLFVLLILLVYDPFDCYLTKDRLNLTDFLSSIAFNLLIYYYNYYLSLLLLSLNSPFLY